MTRSALLCLLLLPLVALAQDADPAARFRELEKEFKEVRKSATWAEVKKRRDLINQIADVDHPGAAPLLLKAFTDDREQVCRVPAMVGVGKRGNFKVLKSMIYSAVRDRNEVYRMCLPLAFAHVTDEKIGPWLADSLLKQKKDPILRAAVVECLGLAHTSEAYEALLAIVAEEKRDKRVLYEALIAIARIGEAQAMDPIVPFLEHDDRVLREGAVIALGETGHPAAVEEILPLAKDVAPRVQEAVVEVIRARKAEEALPVLVELLESGRLRVIDTARRALEEITGEELGIDPEAWKRWMKLRERPETIKDEIGSVATYYGMRVFSDRLLFILDVSGSMKAGEPTRLATAKEEIVKTLDQLNRQTMFNLVAFSGVPVWWKEEEVVASEENVKAAKEFVEGLGAGGGTNVYDTFAEAFEKNLRVDTIYFLGDGSPSLGTYTEQEEILARVRWMNRFRKVHIHCIALIRGTVNRFGGRNAPVLGRGRSRGGERAYDEEEAARFLARLAAEHGGSFVKIEK